MGEGEREGGGEGEAEMEGEREGEMEGEGEGQREREGEGEGQREREGEGEGQREREEGERERERKEEGERQREREGGMEVEGEGESQEMGADTSQHSNSNSESERNADRENSTESSSSCERFSSDLQLVQEAAERSMQSVVQEAVQRAMDVSLGSNDTTDTAGNRRVSGTVLSTGEATAVEGVNDPQSVRQSVSGASARPRDTDFSSPFSRSAELHSSQDEAGDYFSPPASPLVADVREIPPTAPPSSSGNRSRDRSPDHSYRRSRFRVQRKRTEKFEGAVSGGGCEDREEGERGEGGTTRRGNLACERCPQLQPFMVYKGHRRIPALWYVCVHYLHYVWVTVFRM